MFDKHFVGLDLTGVENNGIQRPVSRVTLLLDDDNVITVGDDTGVEIQAPCPYGTQAMAESILAQVKGYRYQMLSAENTALDPAAELGDGVTAGGLYSVISRIAEDGSGFPGVTAPGEEELEKEYPTGGGPMTQSFERKIAETRSRITKTAEGIRLEVENEMQGLSASITVELDKITQQVEDAENNIGQLELTATSLTGRMENAEGSIGELQLTASSLTTRITGAEGDISSLELFADNLTLSVTNGTDSSTIKLMSGQTEIASKDIYFTGMVTFNDLSGNKTIINGSTIDTSTLYLDSLYGDTVYIRDRAGNIAASFEATGAVSTSRSALAIWSGAIRMQTYSNTGSGGDIYIRSITGAVTLDAGSGVTCGTDFYPTANGRYSCGTAYFPWSGIYATTGQVSSSDRNAKKDIDYDMSRYDGLFDRLRPCSFLRKDGTSGRRHHGLIAQDVAAALEAEGLTTLDFAGYCAWDTEDGGTGCGLRYEELIAMLIDQVQRLKSDINHLKEVVL